MKELVMNDYLRSLDALFRQYGVTKAYCEHPFSADKEDGVVLYADIPYSACDAFFKVMDNYMDNEDNAWPEMRSFCLPIKGVEIPLHPVYLDGKFYE